LKTAGKNRITDFDLDQTLFAFKGRHPDLNKHGMDCGKLFSVKSRLLKSE
jgi:hypothetical protein